RPRAAPRRRAERRRPRFDARLPGLPPRPGRPLALDARGARPSVPREWRVELALRPSVLRNDRLPGNASLDLRRPPRPPAAGSGRRPRRRRGPEPRHGRARPPLLRPLRAAIGIADRQLPRGGRAVKALVT